MSMYDVLVYLFFNTLSIHVKLMKNEEMQIDDDKFKKKSTFFYNICTGSADF